MLIVVMVLVFFVFGEGVVIHYLLKDNNGKSIFNHSDTGRKLELLRRFWGPFVLYVVATSATGLFLGSVFSEKAIAIESINTWVSLILGLVALVIGIISLFLSFYNVDQSVQASKDNKNDIEKMQEHYREEMKILREALSKAIEESSNKTINAVQGQYQSLGSDVSVNYQQGDEEWHD